MKSSLINTIKKYYQLYNTFNTRFKRCLIIDLFLFLFLISPVKYFITWNRGRIWGSILFILLITVQGNDEDDDLSNIIKYTTVIKYKNRSLI